MKLKKGSKTNLKSKVIRRAIYYINSNRYSNDKNLKAEN